MRRAVAGVVLFAALLPACSSPEQDDPRPVYFAAPVVMPSAGWAELGRVVAWGDGLRFADAIRWTSGIQETQRRRPVVVVSPPRHRAAASAQAPSTPGTGRCGGDLPPCWVMNRESGGNIHAYNPTGCSGRGCYGKWQCDPRSCNGTGTEAQQDAEAARLWDGGAGCAAWDAC